MHLFLSLIFVLFLAAGSIAKPYPRPGSSGIRAGTGTSAPHRTRSNTGGLLGKKPTRYCGAHRPKAAAGVNTGGNGGQPSVVNITSSDSSLGSAGDNSGFTSSSITSSASITTSFTSQATTPAAGTGVGSGAGAGSGNAIESSTTGAGSGSGSGTDTTGSDTTDSDTTGSDTTGSDTTGSGNTSSNTASSATTLAGTPGPTTTGSDPSGPNNSTITSSAPQQGGGSCPAGFLNVVFNTNAGSLPGWANNAIWTSLAGAGISNWIGFSLGNGYNEPAYAGMTPQLDTAQIPICMNPDKVGTCVQSLTSDHPPEYMEIFNEMDYSWEGMTPTADPQTAANTVPPIFAANTPTKLISPALAYTGSSWLPQFGAACNGCMEKIDIVAGHIYNKDPAQVMNIINQFHNQWPDKKIWLTELAPASSKSDGCTFGDAEMINWMQTLLPQILKLGYVEKVFWNNGAWVCLILLSGFSFLLRYCE